MDLNLRQAIVQRVRDHDVKELREVVEDSIGHAEVTLPGLGVLFEMIWQGSPEEDRERMMAALHGQLARHQSAAK